MSIPPRHSTPRRQDWPEALAQYLTERQNVPFTWGANDCGSFVSDGVQAMTGTDPMLDLRSVTSAKDAARLLKATSLHDLTTARLGPELDTPALAQRGDVLLIKQTPDGDPLLALCIGSKWAAPGPDGVVVGSMSDALAAWPVGRM